MLERSGQVKPGELVIAHFKVSSLALAINVCRFLFVTYRIGSPFSALRSP